MQPKVNALRRGLSVIRETFARKKVVEQTERSLSKILEGLEALGLLEAQCVVEVMCTAFEGKFDIISPAISRYWLLSRIV